MSIDATILAYFADFIRQELGIEFSENNYFQLESRLVEVATKSGFSGVNELYSSIKDHMPLKVKILLLDTATNNETLFFRDKKMYDNFEKEILGSKLFQKQVFPFRIWSAACSTGQEVYSIAMILKKNLKRIPLERYSILATDISTRVIEYAQKGVYNQIEVQRGLQTHELIENFEKSTSESGSVCWKIKESLKDNIVFSQHNLLKPLLHSEEFNVVFLRNVLIYQSVENKRKILENIYKKLLPGGYLILGGPESLIGVTEDFEMVDLNGECTFYRRGF